MAKPAARRRNREDRFSPLDAREMALLRYSSRPGQ